eukprot:TRINITY_DN3860_c0_g1_i1.p1 TRINITY_DN3860_c0_g1~~TRINITY_DN3860_c0_g1_i1.p1  ORF type:complete len:382 (-),score=86.03 TRINITY_DN3860_c0_g1_i1:328-1473(-)
MAAGEYAYELFQFSHETTEHIKTLPQKLSLLTIQTNSLSLCLDPLIRLAFYSEKLFSFTETPDEVSLIIEQDSLDQFPSDPSIVTISGQTYRALEVWEGEQALDCIGAVRQLALPLETAKIPCVYLSTFNTDLILVDENDLSAALEVLEQSVKRSSINKSSTSSSPTLLNTRHPYRLSLLTFLRREGDLLMHPLLKQLLFTSGPRFFNFTATQKEITVVTERHLLNSFLNISAASSDQESSSSTENFSSSLPSSLAVSTSPSSPTQQVSTSFEALMTSSPQMNIRKERPSSSFTSASYARMKSIVPSFILNPSTWVSYELHAEGDSGHVEGMVSVVSDVLYHSKISMYYISTFTTDFFLVHEEDAERTTQSLKHGPKLGQK